jgi:hypothetical protein
VNGDVIVDIALCSTFEFLLCECNTCYHTNTEQGLCLRFVSCIALFLVQLRLELTLARNFHSRIRVCKRTPSTPANKDKEKADLLQKELEGRKIEDNAKPYLNDVTCSFAILFDGFDPKAKTDKVMTRVFLDALRCDIRDDRPELKYQVEIDGKIEEVLVQVCSSDALDMLEKLTYVVPSDSPTRLPYYKRSPQKRRAHVCGSMACHA